MNGRLCGFYPQRGISLVRGVGSRVWDTEERDYLDCVTGHGVLNLGHGHPAVNAAIKEQMERMMIVSNVYGNDVRDAYVERLTQLTPGNLNQVFLCNSGTEAVEAALKMAQLVTGRQRFIATKRGFHGRTHGSLGVTFNPKYRQSFATPGGFCSFSAFNKIEPLEELIGPDTAGVIMELVQGEGGVNPAEAKYVHAVQALCREHGALLIIDEVQTGFGRTGTLFACEHYQLVPDILVMAKAMGGGLPMGGVACRDEFTFSPGLHGSTFGGNPLACAAGLAILQQLSQPGFLAAVRGAAEAFRSRLERGLKDHDVTLRGLGYMLGIQLRSKVKPVLMELQQHGVLALPAGPKVLRFLPPLNLNQEERTTIVERTLQSIELRGAFSL